MPGALSASELGLNFLLRSEFFVGKWRYYRGMRDSGLPHARSRGIDNDAAATPTRWRGSETGRQQRGRYRHQRQSKDDLERRNA
ncbi:MAG: hypothetical protein DMF10_03605 [Verrucomicrobia bacterium]|nr:MAG: hypothetical protein DMF10_03605 [Verrucomicrobiota bacterium]